MRASIGAVAALIGIIVLAGCQTAGGGRSPSDEKFAGGMAAYNAGQYAKAVQAWQPLAEAGDAEARTWLGILYEKGHGVPRDTGEAVRLYQLAADQGNARAQYSLGISYMNGKGVPRDEAEAARWYRLAALQGFRSAEYNLGIMYLNGRGVARDDGEALTWLRRAAEHGYADAQHNLALMYMTGRGTAPDMAEAMAWLRRAAAQGVKESQYALGANLQRGIGTKQDAVEAHKWLSLALAGGVEKARADLRDLEPAMTPEQLATAREAARTWEAVAETEQAAAAANNAGETAGLSPATRTGAAAGADASPPSKVGVAPSPRVAAPPGAEASLPPPTAAPNDEDAARRFTTGKAAYERGDYRTAFAIFRALAEDNDIDAMPALGTLYYLGYGVAQDYDAAMRWFRRGAEAGNSQAQMKLGGAFANGKAVPRDDAAAAHWYGLAAVAGVPMAQAMYGYMIDRGRGLPRDPVLAFAWYTLSLRGDLGRSRDNIEIAVAALVDSLSDSEYREAEAMVRQWRPGETLARHDTGGPTTVTAQPAPAAPPPQGSHGTRTSTMQLTPRSMTAPPAVLDAVDLYEAGDYGAAAAAMLPFAKGGDLPSQIMLGLMLREGGRGLAKDDAQALYWWTRAADQGDSMAQGVVGNMLINGEGAPRDREGGAAWIRRAAMQGDADMQGMLATLYLNGPGSPQDMIDVYVWSSLAIRGKPELSDGIVGALNEAAKKAMPPDDQAKAERQIANFRPRPETAAGTAPGPSGDGSAGEDDTAAWTPEDLEKARAATRPAAEAGVAEAQSMLGLLYEYGDGSPEELAEAVRWYRLSVAQGDPRGLSRLGTLYIQGKGVPLDIEQGTRLIREAAEQGFGDALLFMGIMHLAGEGVRLDAAEAYKWLVLAAQAGVEDASATLAEVERGLTPEERREGERRARAWRPRQGVP